MRRLCCCQHVRLTLFLIHVLIVPLLLDMALSLSKATLMLDLILQLRLVNANPRSSQLCKEARGLRCTIPFGVE